MSGLCEFPDCGRPVRRRGLCWSHYRQQAQGRDLTPIQSQQHWDGPCAGPGCERPAEKKGLCPSHYKQRTLGRDLTPLRSRSRSVTRWTELFDQIDRSWLPIVAVVADAETTLGALERAAYRHGRADLANRARRARQEAI